MTGVTDGLWIAACANAVAALALTLLGRQPQRGWRLWQTGAWLGTAGIALLALAGQRPVLLALAQLLLLQWPMLALVGMRRFHARFDWPGNERHDWAVLALCGLLVVGAGAVAQRLGLCRRCAPPPAPCWCTCMRPACWSARARAPSRAPCTCWAP
jgi:hypothetical protein